MKILKKLLSIFLCVSILFVQLLLPTTAQAIESNVNLSNIKLDNVSLDNFSPNIFEYNITVEASKESIDILAESEDMSLNITGDIGSKNLIMDENQFTITVTSGDGLETQVYTLNITRAEAAIPTPSPTSTPEPSPSSQPSAEATQSSTVTPELSTEPATTPSASEVPTQTNRAVETSAYYPKAEVVTINGFKFDFDTGTILEYVGNEIDLVVPSTLTDIDTVPVTTVATGAFSQNDTLNSITFSNNLNKIETGAFSELSNLTTISLPESVSSISSPAFDRCENLLEINVDSQNAHFSSINGILFNKDKTTLIRFPAGKSDINYNIPLGVEIIDSHAFSRCIDLDTISLPESVVTLELHAFMSCVGLEELILPYSLTSIGNGTFDSCTGLRKIHIKSNVTFIDNDAFISCTNFTIYGESGSFAETYASNNSFPFVVESANSEATLSSLTINSTTVTDFNSATYSYDITIVNSTESVTVGATTSNVNATLSGDVGLQNLAVGENVFTVTCTTEDGFTTQDYILNVTREAPASTDSTLSDLTVDTLTIDDFDSSTYTYDITVNNSTESIEIGATSTDANATITGDTGTQPLDVGVNTFTVICTAEDGVILQDYVLNITRSNVDTIPESNAFESIGFNPLDLQIDPNRSAAYALNPDDNNLYKIDIDTGSISYIAFQNTGSEFKIANGNIYLPVDSDTSDNGMIAVIDTSTFTLTTNFSIDIDPYDVAISGDYIYVSSTSANIIKSYNINTYALKSTMIDLDTNMQIEYNTHNNKLYGKSSNLYSNETYVITCTDGTMDSTIEYNLSGNGYLSPDERYFYSSAGYIIGSELSQEDLNNPEKLERLFWAICFDLGNNIFFASYANSLYTYIYNTSTVKDYFLAEYTFVKILNNNGQIVYCQRKNGGECFLTLNPEIHDRFKPSTSVYLDYNEAYIKLGDSRTLFETVLPENATNKYVEWSTSDASIATVKDGIITSHSLGTCTITATTTNGGYTASCIVNVISDCYVGVFTTEFNGLENLGFIPSNVAVDPDRQVAYLTAKDSYKLYCVDLTNGNIVFLEFTYKATQLTVKNGKVYLILPHNRYYLDTSDDIVESGTVAVIDTATYSIDNIFDVDIDPYDIEADSQGKVYISSYSDLSWSYLKSYNSNTGELLSSVVGVYSLSLFDYNEAYNKLYSSYQGISPNDIEAYEITNGLITDRYDSPYHGDYSLYTYFQISPEGNYIFNSSGNIFTCAPTEDGDMIYDGNISDFNSVCFDLGKYAFYTSKDNVLNIYDYSSRNHEKQITMNDEIIHVFCEYDKLILLQKNSSDEYYIDFSNTHSFNENNTLSDLTVDTITIDDFNSSTLTYNLSVDSSTESIEIGATSTDANATITGDTGTQSLEVGVNTFTITCTAEDDATWQDYSINVTRESPPSTDATLSTITVDESAIDGFDTSTHTYDLIIDNLIESIEIGATSTDVNATITGDTRTQSLSVGANTFTLTCTAEDGVTTQKYILNVTREVPVPEGIVFDANTGTITGYTGEATTLEIPSIINGVDVVAIGDNVFNDHKPDTSLVNVILPNTITSIGSGAFRGCTNLISVDLPDNITSISSSLFSQCDKLNNIIIPENVTSIESNAFYYCKSLQSIDIPSKVTSIGNQAFSGCQSLSTISISSEITSIGEDAFSSCLSLENFYVDQNNPNYKSIDGALYNKNGTTLIQYNLGSSRTSYTIPSSVKNIERVAFYQCENITNIIIPDNVENVGDFVFGECTNLVSISLGSGLKSISAHMFQDCSSLTDITIPDSVSYIGELAFHRCNSLEDITVSNNNQSYISINGVLFSKDGNTLIYYPPGNSRENYIIPEGTTIIEDYAFFKSLSLQYVTIPSTVQNIGEFVFYSEEDDEIDYFPYPLKNFIIRGESGSFAETYAESNGIIFIPIGSTSNSKSSSKVAILFGMADYAGTINDLEGPVNDIISMKAALVNAGYTVYKYMDYSGANMLSTVQSIASSMSSEGTLLFVYSGHGADGGYLVGADNSFISISELESKLSIHSGTKEVIIDACYSGDFIGKDFTPNDSVRIEPEKSFNDYVISVFSNSEINTNSKNLAHGNYYVMTACSGSQLSYEFLWNLSDSPFAMNNLIPADGYTDAFWSGYFSLYFQTGFGLFDNPKFKNLWADINDDNLVTWNELYQFSAYFTNDEQQAQVYPVNSNHIIYDGVIENDHNNDEKIDMLDIIIVAQNYNTTVTDYDMNNDGIVNLFDLVLLSNQIG